MTSAVSVDVVRLCIMDPIRRLCESHQFHFLVVLQSISQPQQRFWTASKQLGNVLGAWVTESATYVEGLHDGASGLPAFSQVPVADQPIIQTEVLGHSFVCSLVRSHRSLVRSLRSLLRSWESKLLNGYFICVFPFSTIVEWWEAAVT